MKTEQAIRGSIIGPDDLAYEEARSVWNGRVDRHPAMIVRCQGVADVIAALDLARSEGLPVTVRGGGQSIAGSSVADGALLVDLSRMRSVSVDPAPRTVRVGAGATWGLVDHETQAFGLAVTGSVDSRTGVGGMTLGGGIGYLARAHGLTIDHLMSADVVLADGRLVTASMSDNEDLFWALRGGGGNFGIVTSFTFRLNAVGPEVMTARTIHQIDDAESVLRLYREFQLGASNDVSCYASFVNASPGDRPNHDSVSLALVACHAGSLDQGTVDLAPLADFGSPSLSTMEPMPYATLQSIVDDEAPRGHRYYWKARHLDVLSDEAIATIVANVDPLPGHFSRVFIEPLGGAISNVSPEATAYPHRSFPFGLGISSGWTEPSEDAAAIAWTRTFLGKLERHLTDAVNSNYLDGDESDRVEEAYGGNLDRLQAIKARYDPDNVFCGNQNIVPAG